MSWRSIISGELRTPLSPALSLALRIGRGRRHALRRALRRTVAVCAAAALVVGAVPTAHAATVAKSIVTMADETGLGTLHASLAPQPFASQLWPGIGFAGTVESRVYVNATFDVVTFIYEIVMDPIVSVGSEVDNMQFARPDLTTPDLDFSEITAGTLGYLTTGVNGPTTTPDAIPDTATVVDNPSIDTLDFNWTSATNPGAPGANDRAVLYVQTDGNVDSGEIRVLFTDFGSAAALVLAPLDDASNPDISTLVPTPTVFWAGIVMIGLGVLPRFRRRDGSA